MKRPETQPSPRPYSRLDRLLVTTSMTLLALMLPSSVPAPSVDNRLAYDTAPRPVPASTTDGGILPIDQEVPSLTPAATAPRPRECRAGRPVLFTWRDVGVIDAPIEPVGTDTKGTETYEDDVIIEPKGRDANGKYNTIGWWKDGAKPGDDSGSPVFLAHSTQVEPSLFPRNEFALTLEQIKAIGGQTTWLVSLDNGSVCEYIVRGEDMYLKVSKEEDRDGNEQKDYTDVINTLASNEIDKPLFVTCAGDRDYARGTSKDSSILVGTPLN